MKGTQLQFLLLTLVFMICVAAGAFLLSAQDPVLADVQNAPVIKEIEPKPSRENFFREVLYAQLTEITPLFDDYTPGSYHVDKLDVFRGIPRLAAEEHLRLRGLIVIGPSGFLWSYHMIVFIEEDSGIRVNLLRMPHARITLKSTGKIPARRYGQFMKAILETGLLSKNLPPKGDCEICGYPEYDYEILLADWSAKKEVLLFGRLDEVAHGRRVNSFIRKVDRLLSGLDVTYALD